jgi:hypothetical protein
MIKKCGQELYDDFVKLRPGAVEELATELREYNNRKRTVRTYSNPVMAPLDHQNQTEQPSGWKHSITQLWTSIQKLNGSTPKPTLPPTCQGSRNDIELGLRSETSGNRSTGHDFVLLCVPFLRWAMKLHQSEVCRINSDQEFSQVLRHHYNAKGVEAHGRSFARSMV